MSWDPTLTDWSVSVRIKDYVNAPPACRVFHGLEVRGMLARMVEDVSVKSMPGETHVDVGFRVPSVVDGESTSLRIGQSVPDVPPEARRDSRGRVLTMTQFAIQLTLRQMWNHEFDEGLAIDGVPLERPELLHSSGR